MQQSANKSTVDNGRGGFQVGRYLINGRLGRDKMGVVYRAEDPMFKRTVAIKVLFLDEALNARESFRQRLWRDIHQAERLKHANIVQVYEIDESNGTPFVVMDFLRGVSLRECLENDEKLDLCQILQIVLQVAKGLEYAHTQGIYHRNIKPENILLTSDGVVKIINFGTGWASDAAHVLTKGVPCAPEYLAPEQLRGGPIDARTDVFSLGLVFYELLARKNPFAGQNFQEIKRRLLQSNPSLSGFKVDIPVDVVALLKRAMAKEPVQRYARVRDMGKQLVLMQRSLCRSRDSDLTVIAERQLSLDSSLEAVNDVTIRFTEGDEQSSFSDFKADDELSSRLSPEENKGKRTIVWLLLFVLILLALAVLMAWA